MRVILFDSMLKDNPLLQLIVARTQIDLNPTYHNGRKGRILTFFSCGSSSTGYHFCAFWLECGITLSPFPNFFVWPVESDILTAGTKASEKKWDMTVPGCRRRVLLEVNSN